MTPAEFLAPLSNSSSRDKCVAILYFKRHFEAIDAMSASQVKAALVHARVAKARTINTADVLNRCGALVDIPISDARPRLWRLTPTGEERVRVTLCLSGGQPEIENSVTSLELVAAALTDLALKDYILESVKCLKFGAIRAAIVFLWAGAVSRLRDRCVSAGVSAANLAIRRFDAGAREVKKADDFAYLKESTLLLTCEALGVLDKNQRTTLEAALDLRNKCGHPTKYNPGIIRASGVIEDVVGIVFK
jgi:hypothetical protein